MSKVTVAAAQRLLDQSTAIVHLMQYIRETRNPGINEKLFDVAIVDNDRYTINPHLPEFEDDFTLVPAACLAELETGDLGSVLVVMEEGEPDECFAALGANISRTGNTVLLLCGYSLYRYEEDEWQLMDIGGQEIEDAEAEPEAEVTPAQSAGEEAAATSQQEEADGEESESVEVLPVEDEVADVLLAKPEPEAAPEVKGADEAEETDKAQPDLQPEREEQQDLVSGDASLVDPSTLSARELARRYLADGVGPEDVPEMLSLLDRLLAEGRDIAEDDRVENSLVQALVLAKTLAMEDRESYGRYYDQLLLASDLPLDERQYTGAALIESFSAPEDSRAMHLAALLRALFAPDEQFDYILPSHAERMFNDYDSSYPQFPMLKQLFNLLQQVPHISANGFSDAVLSQFNDQEKRERHLQSLRESALRLHTEPSITTRMNGIREMKALCFGQGSLLRRCLEIISEHDLAAREEVKNVYLQFVANVQIASRKYRRTPLRSSLATPGALPVRDIEPAASSWNSAPAIR